MGRPRNPLGDPVSVVTQGAYLRVRYYPTGLITEPRDRKWLPGKWRKATQRHLADEAAAGLRESLLDHRAAHGQGTTSEMVDRVTVKLAVQAFLNELENDEKDEKVAKGTRKARASQLNVNLVTTYGSHSVDMLSQIGPAIVAAVLTAERADGGRKESSTVLGALDALALFGRWLEVTYRFPDPFDQHVRRARAENNGNKKSKAKKKVHRQDPWLDDHDVGSIDPKSVPSVAEVIGLRDGIIRRESGGPSDRPTSGRGSRGGAKVLSVEVAAQSADGVTLSAASGVRQCELLVLHTSRICVDDGVILVDRQLDRYEPWLPGHPPPMVPPKGDEERRAQVLPSYEKKLATLVEYADEYTDGWLFAPTRGQKWWAEGYVHMVARAQALLEAEHDADGGERRPVWRYKFHSLRHSYASYALAPLEAGGLGWSLSFVQKSLGHQSQKTTETIYRHIIDEEQRAARRVPHVWPGL